MKDSLGQPLSIGDKVAFVTCWNKGTFNCIDQGIIEKICERMVWICETSKLYKQKSNRYDIRCRQRYANKTLRYSNRVIKL